jgi:peptidoglycan-N-acetylglucosamine deacetylase
MMNWTYGPRAARAAVSLTYDDALLGHWREVAPLLEAAGVRGTFNVYPVERFLDHIEPWRRVAAAGHELGNHTLFHPCRKEPRASFGWLSDDFDLVHYSAKRWREEVRVANGLLRLVDGRSERTFANTCCNTTIGSGEQAHELAPLILEQFVAGRGPCNGRIVLPGEAELGGLGHFRGDGMSFADLREQLETAMEVGGWIIYMFHGVGSSEHRLHILPEEHARLVEYLGQNQDRIWTAPMVDVAREVAKLQDSRAAAG